MAAKLTAPTRPTNPTSRSSIWRCPARAGSKSYARSGSGITGPGILVFSMHRNAAFATQAFQAGAAGYITKSSDPGLLIDAIRDVTRGVRAISPDISRNLALHQIEPNDTRLDELSPREFEIFRMIAEARSTAEIARTLNLSAKTIANYRYLIRGKLDVSSDIELAHLATRHKVIDPAAD